MNWKERIEKSHQWHMSHTECAGNKHDFILSQIFDVWTYDDEQSQLLCTRAIEVALAILNQKTFEYITDLDCYTWYLTIVHWPFFADRITWGTSIRGAWWSFEYPGPVMQLSSCGLINDDGDQQTEWVFTEADWSKFLEACAWYVS